VQPNQETLVVSIICNSKVTSTEDNPDGDGYENCGGGEHVGLLKESGCLA